MTTTTSQKGVRVNNRSVYWDNKELPFRLEALEFPGEVQWKLLCKICREVKMTMWTHSTNPIGTIYGGIGSCCGGVPFIHATGKLTVDCRLGVYYSYNDGLETYYIEGKPEDFVREGPAKVDERGNLI